MRFPKAVFVTFLMQPLLYSGVHFFRWQHVFPTTNRSADCSL